MQMQQSDQLSHPIFQCHMMVLYSLIKMFKYSAARIGCVPCQNNDNIHLLPGFVVSMTQKIQRHLKTLIFTPVSKTFQRPLILITMILILLHLI